jgi:hypothetical protein
MAGLCPYPIDQIASQMSSGGGTTGAQSTRRTGTVNLTANGVQDTFTFPHTLAMTPTYANVTPKNALSATPCSIVWDAANITIMFLLAPDAGPLELTWIVLG